MINAATAHDPDLSSVRPWSANSRYAFSAFSYPLFIANLGFDGKWSSLIIFFEWGGGGG